MLRSLLSFFVILVVSAATAMAQCPTLTGPSVTPTSACVGNQVILRLTGGTNLLPSPAMVVDWHMSTTPLFTPNPSTYIGSANITGPPTSACTQPPVVLGGIINACNGPVNPNNGSEENELVLMWSGSGFNANDFGFHANNSLGGAQVQDIGVLGSCPLSSFPSAPFSGSCVILGGPSTVVPPNAFVVLFTSSLADLNRDFSGLCATGRPVYVFQNSCSRLVGGNVSGAFSNGSPGADAPYFATFGCTQPSILNYFGTGGNNTTLEGWAVGGFPFNVPCGSTPIIPTPPIFSGGPPPTIDPYTYTVQASDCGPRYFRAVVNPTVPGCPANPTNAVTLNVECPTAQLSGTQTVCQGQFLAPINIMVANGGASYTVGWTLNGASQPPATGSGPSIPVQFPTNTPGTYTVALTSVSGSNCTGVASGSYTVTVEASTPIQLTPTTICANQQPFALTPLLAGSSVVGVWSGPIGVSGGNFNAGPAASGPYTVTYTPTGTGCLQANSTTLTVTAPQASPLASPPSICRGASLDLNSLRLPSTPNGSWQGPNVVGSTLTVPPGYVGSTITVEFVVAPGAGCFTNAFVTVNISNSQPLSISPPPALCPGQSIDLNSLLSPGAPMGVWSGGAGFTAPSTFTVPSNPAVNYTLTYTPQASSCFSASTVTIPTRPASPTNINAPSICASQVPFDLRTLEPAGLTGGVWTGGIGVVTGGNSFSPSPANAGSYPLTYTPPATAGPCVAAANVTLVVTAGAPVALRQAADICQGASLDLNTLLIGGPIAGSWTVSPNQGLSGANFSIPVGGGAGLYSLTFTPAGGNCLAPNTTSVRVTLPQNTNLDQNVVVCVGNTLNLNTLFLSGTIAGTWSGNGVNTSTGIFTAAAGSPSQTVTFTPAAGSCANPTTATIGINSPQAISLTRSSVCANFGIINLSTFLPTNPPNGTWSSNNGGLVGNTFDPVLAGSGQSTLTFTPSAGCFLPASVVITPATAVNISPISQCTSPTPFNLSSLEPAGLGGGTWSGSPRVIGNNLDVSTAGNFSITYTPPATACASPVQVQVNLNASGAAMPLNRSTCIGGASIVLSTLDDPNFPGGVWRFNGTVVQNFDPAGRAPGAYQLTYTPSGPCVSPGSATITLTPNTSLSLGTRQVCVNVATFDLNQLRDPAYPLGTWSGPNLTGSIFNVTAAGAGNHIFTFTPTDVCVNLGTTTVTINAATPVNVGSEFVCINNLPFDLSQLLPSGQMGGTWSGPNVIGSVYSPGAAAVAGTFDFTYTPVPNAATCLAPGLGRLTVGNGTAVQLQSGGQVCAGGVLDLNSLLPGSSISGVWSGSSSIVGSIFSPPVGTSGPVVLTFTPAGGNTCVTGGSTIVQVLAQAPPSAYPPVSLCTSDAPLALNTLVAGPDQGGVWTLNGQTLQTFDPAANAPGNYNLQYVGPVANCGRIFTLVVTVNAAVAPVLQTQQVCNQLTTFDLQNLRDLNYPNGSWVVNNTPGNIINPSNFPLGPLSVLFISSDNCVNRATTTIQIVAAPPVAFVSRPVCANSGSFDLNELLPPGVTGGSWSGTNVTANQFDTRGLAPGSFSVIYQPATGVCFSTSTAQVVVTAGGAVQLATDNVCALNTSYDLNQLLLAASTGIWTGSSAITGSNFNAVLAGAGTVNLTFTPSNSCFTAASTTLVIEAQVVLQLDSATVCEGSGAFDLRQLEDPRSPTGTWSGPGTSPATAIFNPSGLATQPQLITFTPTGICAAPTQTTIKILSSAVATVNDQMVCSGGKAIALSDLTTDDWSDGTWAGAPRIGDSLMISNLPPGTYRITFTPNSSCLLPGVGNLLVTATRSAFIPDQQICLTAPRLNLGTVLPTGFSGGNWIGPGVTNNLFDPQATGLGTFLISYEPTGSCGQPSTFNIEVSDGLTLAIPDIVVCIGQGTLLFSNFDPPAAPGGNWSLGTDTVVSLDLDVLGAGTNTLRYTPPSGTCVANIPSIRLEVMAEITLALSLDSLCFSSSPIDLSAYLAPSGRSGSWSGNDVQPDGSFSASIFAGASQVTFTPDDGACYASPAFTFDVVAVSELVVGMPSFSCAGTGNTYTATVVIDAAQNNGTIRTSLGTLVGSILTITGLVSGAANSVTINDASNCTPEQLLDLSFNCVNPACTTNAGMLSGGPFELCPGDVLSSNEATGVVFDQDDIIIYVLDTDEDPSNGYLAIGLTPAFTEPPSAAGRRLYLYAYVGNPDGAGFINTQDTCAARSNSLRIRWAAPLVLDTNASCAPDGSTFTITVSISGGVAPYRSVGPSGGRFSADGRTFTSDPIAAGLQSDIRIVGSIICDTASVTLTQNCISNCVTPNPGSFAMGPTVLCGNLVSSAGYNNDAQLMAGDLQVFIVYADAAKTMELFRTNTLPIDFASFGASRTLFLTSLAGKSDGNGGIDTSCASESEAQEVRIGNSVTQRFDTIVCPATSIVLFGQSFTTTSSTGSVIRQGQNGACDTTVMVTVNFTQGGNRFVRNETYCNDEEVTIGGRVFNATNPSASFSVGSGMCQDQYEVSLTFRPAATFLLQDELCAGDERVIGNQTFNLSNPRGLVVLVAKSGCDSLVTVDLSFLEAPKVSLAGDAEFCNPNEIAVLVAATGTRRVTADIEVVGAAPRTVSLPPGDTILRFPVTGNFSLRLNNIQASTGGCSASNPSTLSYNPIISRLRADVNEPLGTGYVACDGSPVPSVSVAPVGGRGPFRYSWSRGDTTQSIRNVEIGTYQVTLTDALGCQDMAEVIVRPADTLGYTVQINDPTCFGGSNGSISIALDDMPAGLQYRFDLPGLKPVTSPDLSFDSLRAGKYVFQLLQSNGCSQESFLILEDPQQVNLIKRDTIEASLGDSIFLSIQVDAGSRIRWTPGEILACDTCARTYALPTRDLDVMVNVRDVAGCENSDVVHLRILPEVDIFIPTAFSPNADGNNDLLLPLMGPEVERVLSFRIFDRWGEAVHERFEFAPGDYRAAWDGDWRGQPMDPAVFVVLVETRLLTGETRISTGDVLLMR